MMFTLFPLSANEFYYYAREADDTCFLVIVLAADWSRFLALSQECWSSHLVGSLHCHHLSCTAQRGYLHQHSLSYMVHFPSLWAACCSRYHRFRK